MMPNDSDSEGATARRLAQQGAEQEGMRQRRIEALSALASQAGAPPATVAPTARASLAQRRRIVRGPFLLALLVAVLIGGGSVGAYRILSRSATTVRTAIPTLLTIQTADAGLYCPQAPIWSPDGRQVAALGSANASCGRQADAPAQTGLRVVIFDARTGAPQRILDVSGALAAAGWLLSSVPEHLAWASDGHTFALCAPYAYAPKTGANANLLLLYSLAGSQATAPRLLSAPSPVETNTATKRFVWDTQTGGVAWTFDGLLSPALSYHWTSDGRIAPDLAFPADSAATTGRPARAGSIWFWQAGTVAPYTVRHDHYVPSSSADGFVAAFFATSSLQWSPDGRYVVADLGLGGPVAYAQPPAPGQVCVVLQASTPCRDRPLPSPDLAFTAVVQAVQHGSHLTTGDGATLQQWGSAAVAWSRDGGTLFTILPGDEVAGTASPTVVTAFSVATGQPVKQFRLSGPTSASCQGALFSVAPTGAQLALTQCQVAALTLWSAQQG